MRLPLTDLPAAPLVTVVTPCYNSARTIEDTVRSVLGQSYAPIEYIIMDGGSTDGTLDVLRPYAGRLRLVSERDKGQADAINKGWRQAKGSILAWLNADDLYQPDTVQTAVSYLMGHPDVAWVYGYSKMLDEEGKPSPFRHPVREWDYATLLEWGCYIIQPSVFLRREVVAELGYLREELHYCMDYEYWLRIGRKYPGRLVPDIWAEVKWYRANKSLSGAVPRINEIKAMVQSYGSADLPQLMQHEWEEAYLLQAFAALQAGRLSDSAADLRQTLRYPRALPRGLGKLLIRTLIPAGLETRLRRWFVQGDLYKV